MSHATERDLRAPRRRRPVPASTGSAISSDYLVSILDMAHVPALLVADGHLIGATSAMRARLSQRRLSGLAARVDAHWRALPAAAAVHARLVIDDDGDTLHVLSVGTAPSPEPLLVAIVPPARPHTPTARQSRLTPRQALVGRLVARGATTAEVARQLGLSVSTIRRHLEAVHLRLGVKRRAQLGHYFARRESGTIEGVA